MLKKVSEVEGCQGCPMREKFPDNSFVPFKSGLTGRVQIAEAPGADEAIVGEPLVGGAGKWQDNLNRKAGIARRDVWMINVVNCKPPSNMFPTDQLSRSYITKADAEYAVGQCLMNHVIPFLESKAWSRIDLLGEKALRFVGGILGGIRKWRGSPILVDTEKMRQIATKLMQRG